VADLIEVESAHERAVEGFLGDRLQALLVADVAEARRGIRYLQESGKGRASFLPLAGARQQQDCECLRDVERAEPAVQGLLSDLYRVGGPEAGAVAAALPNALVVGGLDEALDVQSRHAGVPVVTLGGEVLRGATVEGGRVVRGLLAPRREVREIGERIERIDQTLAAARERVREQTAIAAEAEALIAELVGHIHDAEKQLVALRHARGTAEEEQRRLQRKASVLRTESSQAEQQKGAAALRLTEIGQALLQADAERSATGERLAALGNAVAEARAASEAAQARFAELRSAVAALRERATAAAAECDRLEESHRELVGRIEAARRRAGELDRRGEELRRELAESERRLSEALVERDRTAGESTAVENRVQEIRNELDGREAALKERRRERDTLRAAVAELDVERARIASDLDHLARESFQTVDRTAAECASALSDEERGAEAEQLEEQAAELRQKLERMGAVNVLAVEQSQELEERHQFLTAQRQDLLDSIAELESAVRKIDRASRERFREAFQVINQHFGEVFRQLFGGGTAGLSLLDENDLLESGIDVMAQPPGKRLQNVMLLSGGEKALTAIALLFAIFQYKPSPFCILDEVDAPLDDANIGRFVRMLEGMKEHTQFVLITHSRKTMEIADQLYGVTMEEPGVSKLVSVQFA
jgi:chromosome segregation protein